MATSQNGWTVFTSGTHRSLVVSPWITGRVRGGSVATVFDYLARRFNAEVEPIRRDWSWGYAYRAIRGKSSGYSNHASGTAVDFNAPEHPLGERGTFTAAQRAAIYRILADLDHVVRWGGDYSGRADEMHFEINAPAARVTTVAQRITAGTVSKPVSGGGTLPTAPGGTLPTPLTPEDDVSWDEMLTNDKTGTKAQAGTFLTETNRAAFDTRARVGELATAVDYTRRQNLVLEQHILTSRAETANLVGALAAVAKGETFDEAKLLAGVRAESKRGAEQAAPAVAKAVADSVRAALADVEQVDQATVERALRAVLGSLDQP